MTSGKPTQTQALRTAPDDAWAELCGVDDDDDEEFERQEANYGSLMGLGVRKAAKKPVLVLDPEVAEKAAQVMEINAGQLIVNPDKAVQGFAWPGFEQAGSDEYAAQEPIVGEDAEDEDEDAQAAVAQWLSREAVPEEASPDDVREDLVEHERDAADEAALAEVPLELTWRAAADDDYEPRVAAEEDYEVPVAEADEAELSPGRPIFAQPASEWALGAPGAPPVPAIASAPHIDDFALSGEPEPLLHTADAIVGALPEPEPHGHGLRVRVARLAPPRKSHSRRRLSVLLRRFHRWLRRLVAS